MSTLGALVLRRGDKVEVHTRSQGPNQWIGGVVGEVVGKGAFVRTNSGNQNFFRWKEIRMQKPSVPLPPKPSAAPKLPVAPKPPEQCAPEPRSAPLATIGDAVQRQTILMDLHPGTEERRQPVSKHHKLHDPTPIGEAFRAYRLRVGRSQSNMSGRLKINPRTLSLIELGDLLPNDDLILAFAEESSRSLEDLIKLREASRLHTEPATLSLPLSKPEAEQLCASPSPRPSLAAIVAALESVVPMPAEPEARSRWLDIATELYELRA